MTIGNRFHGKKARSELKKQRLEKCSSGKDGFRDRVAADLFIGSRPDSELKRSYPCPECHKWHITSKKR